MLDVDEGAVAVQEASPTETPDAGPTQVTESATEQVVKAEGATDRTVPDWDSDDNPHKRARAGAEGVIKQLNERVRAAEEMAFAAEQEKALRQAELDGMTPEQIQAVKTQWGSVKSILAAAEQLKAEKAQIEALKAELLPYALEREVGKIAKEHGLTREDLDMVDVTWDRTHVLALAKKLQGLKRTEALQTRKANGTDKAESSGGGVLSDDDLISYVGNQNNSLSPAQIRRAAKSLGLY